VDLVGGRRDAAVWADVVLIGLDILYAIASLFIVSIGLAIAFGMMRVINFAHGEFIMLGGFAMIFAVRWGVNFWLAMIVVAPLAVGVFGIVVERIIIRPLYGRILDTVLATWGLSLLIVGVASIYIGFGQRSVAAPLASITVAGVGVSLYNLFVIGAAVAVAAALYFLMLGTRFGLLCRGAMQDPEMAAAIGINLDRIYAATFALSAALAGFAGAVMAPLTGVVPTSGLNYINEAFITVIIGGANAVTGTLVASGLFGTVSQVVTILATPVLGQVVMLIAGIVLLRVMPAGITGRIFRKSI
jgi:branched-chain amino acid transport system permease protein